MRPFIATLCSTSLRVWDWLFCGITTLTARRPQSSSLPMFYEDNIYRKETPMFWSTQVDDLITLPLLTTTSALVGYSIGRDKGGMGEENPHSHTEDSTHGDAIPSGNETECGNQVQRSEPVVVMPMFGVYNWARHYQLPTQGQGYVTFGAECTNDLHIALSSQPETLDPMYEIVIGGWNNTQSVIRRKSQGLNLCTIALGLSKPQPGEVNDIWVSLDKRTRLIQIGRGLKPSLDSLFCIYKDPCFLAEAQYICITSWNTPVRYSHVEVSAI